MIINSIHYKWFPQARHNCNMYQLVPQPLLVCINDLEVHQLIVQLNILFYNIQTYMYTHIVYIWMNKTIFC